MLPFQTLIPIDKKASTPVYLQVANRLVTLIREGIIKPGAALPGSREMAALLQLHRKTIVAAYEELYTRTGYRPFPAKAFLWRNTCPK